MKYVSILICMVIFTLFLPTAASETFSETFTDDVNDVTGLNGTVDAPNADIEQITYYQNGKNVVITLRVVDEGSIDDKAMYTLVIQTNAADADTKSTNEYQIIYTNNPLYANLSMAVKNFSVGGVVLFGEDYQKIPSQFTKPSKNILRISFDLKNSDEKLLNIGGTTTFMDEAQLTFGMDYAVFNVYNETANNSSSGEPSNNKESNNEGSFSNTLLIVVAILLVVAVAEMSYLLLKRR